METDSEENKASEQGPEATEATPEVAAEDTTEAATEDATEKGDGQEQPIEGKKEVKKQGRTIFGIPAYLIVLFLILGIVGGMAIKLTMFPGTPSNGFDNPPDNGNLEPPMDDKVSIMIVYADECEICKINGKINNSIIDSFIKYKVISNVTSIEMTSEKGMEMVETYGLISVPTALVDYSDINRLYPGVKDVMNENYNVVNGKYVVPESQWNRQEFYPIMYLEPSENCIDTPGKIDVDVFDDPYSSASLNSKELLTGLWHDLNKDIEARFNYTPTNINDIIPDYNLEEVLLTSRFLACASEQGKYLEMDIYFRAMFCNLPQNDNDVLNTWEIEGCGIQTYDSTHKGFPLTQIELDIAANRAGLDAEALVACYKDSGELLDKSVVESMYYNIKRLPTAVVDCRYIVGTNRLEEAICGIGNNIDACGTG